MKTIFAAQSLLHEGQLALTTEQLVNVYPEIMPGRLPLTIRSCPGLIDVGQFAEGRTEAMLSALDGIYAVCGGLLVRWDGSTFTNLGTVGLGRATMQYNGTQVAVTVGGKYYIYDGTSLTEVTGFAFNTVGSVEFMDGYFMTTDVNSDRWAITAINDGTSIDALDFASAESRPDNLVRIIANGGLVWLMGEETVEPWQNTGNADFPFQRISSTVIEKGLRSVGEATRLDNTIFWNSDESRAYRQVDFQPQKISTASVDTSLDAHTRAVSFAYQYQGQDFYVIRFEDRPAWVYSPATQSWHERATGPQLNAWEVTTTVHHNGIWYAATSEGYLCTFGGFQDRGAEMRREATSRNISEGGKRFVVSRVDIRLEVGAGGSVMSSYSNNGGRTFQEERHRSLGAAGEYNSRTTWRMLGQHEEFAFRLACTDNVDFAIYESDVS